MQSNRQFSRWCLLSAVMVCSVTMAVFVLQGPMYVANGAGQRKKIVARLPTERNEPLRIRTVRANGRRIISGRPYYSNDDWLNDLTVRIQNRSERTIMLAAIQLQFPRPAGSGGPIVIDDINYGNRDLLTRQAVPQERSDGLAPGQTADVKLSSNDLQAIKVALIENGYPLSIEKLSLRISSVIFDDDTMWMAGSRLERDPSDSKTWINVELTNLSKSTPALTSSKSPFDVNANNPESLSDQLKGRSWSFGFLSDGPTKALFLPISYRPIPAAQSGCYQFIGATNEDCGVPGHACTYRKAWVNQTFGGYYLADCSAICSSNCGWHSSKVENPCSGGGGGGSGGGGSGGGGENNTCSSDWDCDFGYSCNSEGYCEDDSMLNQ
jgi:uncharacterized membrane protein YgcG